MLWSTDYRQLDARNEWFANDIDSEIKIGKWIDIQQYEDSAIVRIECVSRLFCWAKHWLIRYETSQSWRFEDNAKEVQVLLIKVWSLIS